MTAAWLMRMGLPDVSALAGGLPAWEAAGGAVETGHPDPEPWGYGRRGPPSALSPPSSSRRLWAAPSAARPRGPQ